MKIDYDSTKGKIIKAAIQLFPEKGYENTSMHEIAESAGVTKPAVYYYFENKEEMFKEIMELGKEYGYQHLKNIINSDRSFREKLINLVTERFNIHCDEPEIERFISWAFTNGLQYIAEIIKKHDVKEIRNYRNLLLDFLNEEKKNGCLKPNVNSEHFFALLIGGINYHTKEFFVMGGNRIEYDDAAQMVDILLYNNMENKKES
ncbi:MAG: TetR/AcrR family transcriptional regulator [Candidatus Marinimicrobia bacterium]|nr:TetR/AcrR family transcriptional regulator [Candidatus Neomarinimicrobiota bacterium]